MARDSREKAMLPCVACAADPCAHPSAARAKGSGCLDCLESAALQQAPQPRRSASRHTVPGEAPALGWMRGGAPRRRRRRHRRTGAPQDTRPLAGQTQGLLVSLGSMQSGRARCAGSQARLTLLAAVPTASEAVAAATALCTDARGRCSPPAAALPRAPARSRPRHRH